MHRRNPPGTSNIRSRSKRECVGPRVRSVLGEALHVRPYFLVVFDVTSHTWYYSYYLVGIGAWRAFDGLNPLFSDFRHDFEMPHAYYLVEYSSLHTTYFRTTLVSTIYA